MEIIVPHRIVYRIERPASVDDVVSALVASEIILRESVPFLAECVDGVTVERIRISVSRISQESPLIFGLLAAIVTVFQKDMEKSVPIIVENFFGAKLPQEYTAPLTIAFCVLLVYGIDSIRNQISKKAFSKRIHGHMDGLVKELSAECGVSEEKIKKIVEKRYGKSRIRILSQAAIDFFKPSKNENNAPVMIGPNEFDSEIVSCVPTEAEIESANVPEIARPLNDVLIDIRAQDTDRSKQGWAGIIPSVSQNRLKMEIFPPITPDKVYTKQRLRGDVMLVSKKKNDGTFKPYMFHLMNIRE